MTGGRGPEWGAADGSLPAFPLSPGLSLCPYGRPQGQQIRPGLPSGSLVSSPNSGPSELHLGPPFWPGARRQGVWAGSESSGALGPPWVPALPVGFPRTALWTCAARGGGFEPWAGGPDPLPPRPQSWGQMYSWVQAGRAQGWGRQREGHGDPGQTLQLAEAPAKTVPAPPPPLHSLSTWGLCANSSWSLLSASPLLLPAPRPFSPPPGLPTGSFSPGPAPPPGDLEAQALGSTWDGGQPLPILGPESYVLLWPFKEMVLNASRT